MIRTREEGGIGLRDPKILNKAATLKRIISLWLAKEEDSIWVTSMRRRYIKG